VIPRATFFLITAFWVVMNVLLWRAEYGPRAGGVPVPADLVWRKILTAPDISSLTIYQDGRKTGFCTFSGSFTDQSRFDARIGFSTNRDWRELTLKFSSSLATVKIHSIAASQTVFVEITNEDLSFSRVFTFADLQNPTVLLHALAGDFTNSPTPGFALPRLLQPSLLAGGIRWEAARDRLMMGREPVSAYRLQTRVLNQAIVIYTSTLGDILRVELPAGITAAIDDGSRR
jgi:hypothetical protein